jgi:hypothetical protein
VKTAATTGGTSSKVGGATVGGASSRKNRLWKGVEEGEAVARLNGSTGGGGQVRSGVPEKRSAREVQGVVVSSSTPRGR